MNKFELTTQSHGGAEHGLWVAAYCRVSTDSEDQSNSFDSQRRYFREYIERHPNWELYEIFADEGISGTSTKKRAAFNRMIACARDGKIDLIITKEISRFARNTLDSIYYTRELKRHGVGVIFLNDGINTLDGDAELRLAIMASIAQEESRKTSERVKWGQKRQMEQGVVFGRSLLGYDVTDGKMTVNEAGAAVVRLIFHKLVSEGKGTHVIARELREAGILPARAAAWSNTVILRLLRNEKYCGDLVQKKTYTPDFLTHDKKYNRGEEPWVVIKNHHEPIIPRETFEAAQRILDARAASPEGKAKYSNRYPFSGKIKCGCCGRSCVARRKRRADGSICLTWRCMEAVKNGKPHTDGVGRQVGCDGMTLRNEDVVRILSLVLQALSFDGDEVIDPLLRIIGEVIGDGHKKNDIVKSRERMRELETGRQRLITLFMAGDITQEEFRKERAECDAKIQELRDEMEKMEKADASKENNPMKRLEDIKKTVREIMDGETVDEGFFGQMLEKMVVGARGEIDVYLKGSPAPWRFVTL